MHIPQLIIELVLGGEYMADNALGQLATDSKANRTTNECLLSPTGTTNK